MSFLTRGPSQPMTVDDRLIHEARVRPRYAVIAALAAVFLLGGSIFQLSGPHTRIDEVTLDLITENKRYGLDLAGSVFNALGWVTLAATLSFLFGAMRARNPQTQPFVRIIAVLGGALAAITGIVDELMIGHATHQFISTGSQTYQQASMLTKTTAFTVVPLIGLIGASMVALAFVLVSLGAMRVGLLTRFMGYLGIFAGVLILFQITQVPIVQGYWLLALAYLLSGRWPTGVPPAWRSGQAEKWPSSQQTREQRIRAAGSGGGGRGRGRATPEAQPVGAPAAAAPSSTRNGAKRKRKRRK